MPRLPILSAASLLLSSALSVPADARTAGDAAGVRRLMDAYHQAVVGHDGARVAALFVPEGAAWFNVLSDEGYARARLKTPEAPKAKAGSVQAIAAFVSASKARLDPNRGSESWQMVKGAVGWRIASIIYSSTPPR